MTDSAGNLALDKSISERTALDNAVEPDQTKRPALTLDVKVLYGVGAMATAVKARMLGLLLLFYNQIIGLDAPLVSAALSISIFVDAVWTPIVGQLSDSTRTRLGRRHPYIYGAVVPTAVFFVMLFTPPTNWSDQALFWYLAVVLTGMRMFESLKELPAAALMPELTRDYDERTNLQAYRLFFSAVLASGLAAFLSFGVFLRGTKAEPFGQFNQAGYAPYAITVAVIGVVAVVASGLATQRFIPFMFRPSRHRRSFGETMRGMRIALSNRGFLVLCASTVVHTIATGMAGGLGLYFFTYIFHLASASLLIVGLSAIPAGLIGVLVAPWLVKRADKKVAIVTIRLLSLVAGIIPLGGWLLGLMPPTAPWVLPVLIADSMISSALTVCSVCIATTMLADVVEDNELRSGNRSEALLFSADSFLNKVTGSIAVLVPGLLIALVHFPMHARPGHVDPNILRELVLVFLPASAFLHLCSALIVLLYPITRDGHEENVRRLRAAAMRVTRAEVAP